MATAWAGQGATQAPQPVQAASTTVGSQRPRPNGWKAMALAGQWSPHIRHSTP